MAKTVHTVIIFVPKSRKALWYKDFSKKKKNESCNTNGNVASVLIWSEWRDSFTFSFPLGNEN